VSPVAWRFALIGGVAVGLATSAAPGVTSQTSLAGLLAAALIAGVTLCAARPRAGLAAAIWLVLVAVVGMGGGMAAGAWRLAVIDRGAFDGPAGQRATAHGFVTAVPRRGDGDVSVRIQTADGRLVVQGHEPVDDLPIGAEIVADGVLRPPEPWQAGYLARYGIRQVLQGERIRLTGRRRAGVAGVMDGIRNRAAAALESGTPEPQAALLRGFLLGEDDRIDARTVEDFKRSGLAHLLAVSGDCVMLLAILGAWLLGLLGVPLRSRLVALLALIAVYVPVAGASPSIQRAGIMGAAGVIAVLAGRPRWRWYAVLLAAVLTLALNPRSLTDPSWQLSFAAVLGILLFAARVRDVILALGVRRSPAVLSGDRGGDHRPSPAGRMLAEGAGVTVAATLTTAPLFAHHFGAVSLASLPANLLALPAIAPMMWLGMLAAIGGQIPSAPVEPLSALAGLLAAYVAQIAHWLAAPGWSQVGVALPSWAAVGAAYTAICMAMATGLAWAGRRRGATSSRPGIKLAVTALTAIAALWVAGGVGTAPGASGPERGLRIVVLDVGQGDSILLKPASGDPVLVDGGPPGDDLRAQLEEEGVSRLAAAVVTHDQADHVGGVEELLYAGLPVHRLLYAEPGADFLGAARAARVRALQVAQGSRVASGGLRLEVLWPPRAVLDAKARDPNQAALVLLARWRSFSMLLAADAEAEAVPLDPGPVDVLKIAHHGSDDAGLDALLDRTLPRLAVISVGADNPYGHPTPQTLATLADHRIPTLRTDQGGDVTIDVTPQGWHVDSG
jgi:competence protein ComEC